MKYNPYSHSKLVVAGCPYRFKRQYIDKDAGDTSSQPSRRGNAIHECFEQLISMMAEGEEIKSLFVKELVAEKIAKFAVTEALLVQECYESVRLFLAGTPRVPADIDTLVDTEEKLAIKKDDNNEWIQCEWDDSEAIFRGMIDLLFIDDNHIATFMDHKTQKNVEKNTNTAQMQAYAFLVIKCYPHVKGIKVRIHYADQSLHFFSKPYSFSREEIEFAEENIMNQIGVIESLAEYGKNTGGGVCDYCSVKSDCPAILKVIEDHKAGKPSMGRTPIVSAAEAASIGEDIRPLLKASSDGKARLQAYVKQIGHPVISGGRQYGFVKAKSLEPKDNLSKKAILDILEKDGQDPMDYVKIDMKALAKSIYVMDGEPTKEIESHIERVYKTSFRDKKL